MIPPLRSLLVAIWVASVAGTVVIVGLSAGYYSWSTFAVAGIVGLALGIPGGLINWAYLRPERAQQAGLFRF